MRLCHFIISLFVGLALSCTPSQSSFKSADSAAIIIKKFSSEDYVNAFGSACARINLATLASKSGLTSNGCELVNEAFGNIGITVTPAEESADCIKNQSVKPYSQSAPFEIALSKKCDYSIVIKIGHKIGTDEMAWLLEGEKKVSASDLAAAPGGRLDVSASLAVTPAGETYGFVGSKSAQPVNNTATGSGVKYKVTFGGGAYTGGALTGEGLNCNHSDANICEKEYPAGSVLNFEMPTTITADAKTYVYAGQVICNSESKNITATGAVVKLTLGPLKSNQACSFRFAERP